MPLGPDGRVELTSVSAGLTQVVVDVQGYFRAGAPTSAGAFAPLNPTRILDTRRNFGADGAVPARGTITVQVAGRGGIPSTGVGAVALNVTVAGPTAKGNVSVYSAGTARPLASNLTFAAGQTVANLVIVPIGAGGKINLSNDSAGSAQLIGDVQGYFVNGRPSLSGSFGRLTPTRILDTRVGLGGSHRAVPGATTNVHIEGFGGVPAAGVSAVVVNVQAVAPSRRGNLAAYPTGVVTPNTSNLSFVAGQTVPNLVIVPVDEYGWITLRNNSTGSTDEIADVTGYFLGTGVIPTVIGPYSYGPFTMGMTVAQATAAYPALHVTAPNPDSCGEAATTGAFFVFNHGSGQLSFITPQTPVQTGDGIHLGDTVASVKARFPWVETFPDDPPMVMAVTQADLTKPDQQQTSYWFELKGGADSQMGPLPSDKVAGVSLDRYQLCFD